MIRTFQCSDCPATFTVETTHGGRYKRCPACRIKHNREACADRWRRNHADPNHKKKPSQEKPGLAAVTVKCPYCGEYWTEWLRKQPTIMPRWGCVNCQARVMEVWV